MPEINVRIDTRAALKAIGRVERTIVQEATIEALNKTALDARDAVKAEMARVFDRPTRWTLNSLFIDEATPGRLSSAVKIIDFAKTGNPAVKYLATQTYGGARNVKRFEKLLQLRGILPPGMVAIPGRDAPLDAHGNIAKGEITKMLSQLQAQRDAAQNETERTKKQRKRRANSIRYFVAYRDGRAVGIFRARGRERDAVAIFFFGRVPTYRARLDFDGIVQRAVDMNFVRQFDKAVRRRL